MAKESATNNSGVFAVVSAVLSILLPITSFPLGFIGGFVFGILALIFGIKQAAYSRNAWSTAAMVLAVIGLILNAIVLYGVVTLIDQATARYAELQQSGVFSQINQVANLANQASA